MNVQRNWAGNYTYSAKQWHYPENLQQVQRLVASHNNVRVVGTRHSFNGIADCEEGLISLQNMNQIELDEKHLTVTVEAGVKYGELSHFLHAKGYALPNLASLPHISVVGAVQTATHGSGINNKILATSVSDLELVTAEGEVVCFSREKDNELFNGLLIGLGGFGVVTKLTLDIIPTFSMSQSVYENLPLSVLEENLELIFSSAYSVSLFTDWKNNSFDQVWIKHKHIEEKPREWKQDFFGALLAPENKHPVAGLGAENCTEQLGVKGPWLERLPHFRMDFTPSSGKELQSEYIIPREYGYDALCAINELSHLISPLLQISEIRTIAKDESWMSPCYKQDSIAIHFTWVDDWELVKKVLPVIETQLEPFRARPHWGKLFTMAPEQLQLLYPKMPDFKRLLLEYDSKGKFQNKFLRNYLRTN